MKRIVCCAAVLLLSCGMNQASAIGLVASGGNGPSISTDHPGDSNGFTITGDVIYDPSAGPWHKNLMNTGSGIASGVLVPITEEFTNTGTDAWTDWHEEIIGPFDPNDFGFGPATVFAFESDSVNVYRNGSLLTDGLDYTLQATLHPVVQPNPGFPDHAQPGQHWQSISIFFTGSNSIQPTDTLTIEKNIFETYLNGHIWTPSIVPVIAQYPTVPEPTTVVYLLTAAIVFGTRRARGVLAEASGSARG